MMRSRIGWLPIGVLALVLTSILAFLYSRSRGHDPAAYFGNEVIVRQLKQLDARWELDVMKSKMGLNSNYDALVDPLRDLNQLQNELQTRLRSEQHQGAGAVGAAEHALSEAISQKTRLIERFKSHNSILRNSLFFLPTAAGGLREQSGLIGRSADMALLDTLVYSQSPSSEGAAQIEARLADLVTAGRDFPSGIQGDLNIFSAHVRTVLREQPKVNSLLRTIAEVPTTARINDLDRLLSNEESRVEQQAQLDRQYLLIFAAALVGLFLYAAVKLLRSHAIINRVNRELAEANAGLEERVKQRTQDLETANTSLTATQAAVRNLLDNAEQGFLTIDSQLAVDEQSSAACRAILGERPAGKSIVELLGLSQDGASAMRTTLTSVFLDSSDYIRELKLGLLPSAFEISGKSVKCGYKMLSADQLMLILTDVTETTRLAAQVERDRLRLEMIVLAFTESEAFAALVEEYRDFLNNELPFLTQGITAPSVVAELYRRVHTFKGLLAQFSFPHSPRCLHGFETLLSEHTDWSAEAAEAVFSPEGLRVEFQRDLDSIGDILGPDFLTSGRRLTLSQAQMQNMKRVAGEALASGAAASPAVRKILRELAELGGLDAKSQLALHGRGATALAERLEKQLAPVGIEGDSTSLEPEVYGDFLRSLVHVFRNAVDHGIEAPEARLSANKPAEGRVRCSVSRDENRLEIVIEDDGRGVDRESLVRKLAAMGVPLPDAAAMPLEALMFREGLSSRDNADEISGRGIGLSAVKAELDRLGGSTSVETVHGAGTLFRFRLPVCADMFGRDSASLEMTA